MSDYLLTLIINYGAPAFGVLLFLGALGVPVGASVLVIAAGAFAQQQILDWPQAALLGLVGAVLGDMFSFGIGHHARFRIARRFGGSPAWRSAKQSFESRAGLAIYLTRFLITALAVPTNLIAGGGGIQFRRFIIYDSLGELTWILLYGGLGYLFGSQWEVVSEFIGNFGGLILGIVLLGGGVWLARRRRRILANAKQKVPEL